jgi:hypothetical protein
VRIIVRIGIGGDNQAGCVARSAVVSTPPS